MLKLGRLLAAVSVLLMSACATVNTMGPSKADTAVDLSKNGLILMTVRLDHPFRSYYTPNPIVVKLERPGAQSSEDRFNFRFDDDSRLVNGETTEYLVRMSLPPGKHQLMGIWGMASRFPITGSFFVPLITDIEVKAGAVTYIGRVEASSRERAENEFRAGPVIPLIDQAVTGFSNGTWEVKISDNSAADVARFKSTFKALEKAQIDNQILPPFDRPKVTAWWEKNG
jgi:hypothetical protein